jgi:UDP-glucose 4-epimerase
VTKYLVTGGAGFIGSHIVEALARGGQRVRVLDNLSTGNRANIEPFRDHVELIEGDLRDLPAVRRAADGVEVVFHEGALASVSRSIEDPAATHEVCATGTLNTLIAARDAGVRRVVYAASSSAYGDAFAPPNREDQTPNPLSPYAAAKLMGEHYCAVFSHVYGLETVRLRYFNVFGPRQDPNSPYSAVIPLFIRAMLAGKTPTIFGDGHQSRDFTYVDNVVHGNLLAAEAPVAAGRLYNLATGGRASLLDLIAMINKVLGTNIVPRHEAARPGDVRHSQADISRARTELGFEPLVDLESGMRRAIEHYKSVA